MRPTSLFSSFLIIALASAAAVNRHDLKKRELYLVKEDVVVVERVDVKQHKDGSFSAAPPVVVRTILAQSTALPTIPANEAPSQQDEQHDTSPSGEKIQPAQVNDAEPINDALKSEPAKEVPNLETPQSEPSSLELTLPSKQEAPSSVEVPQFPQKENFQVKSTGGGKRGIAYNDPNKLKAFTSSSQVSWAYNWGHTAAEVPSNMEFVPMLWGTGIHAAGWHEAANKALKQGCTHLLAFNEPDLGEQSSLSVPLAVAGYRTLMQPYAGRARLGSPAVTNGGTPMGLAYLKEFIAQCTGCKIDFVAIHWYNGGSANDFKNHVTKAHEISEGRPVWITEFQGSGDSAQQQAFLHEVIPWLDQQSFVERYAYFMASDGNLISSGTTLSPVGEAFANSV